MADKITVSSSPTSSATSQASVDEQIKQKQLELLEAQLQDLITRRTLDGIALAEHQEKAAQKEEFFRLRKKRAESLAKDSINTEAVERAKQEACPHINPSGKSDTVSFIDYNQHFVMMCQSCGKQWHQRELGDKFPSHLISRERQIGSYGME